MTMTSFTNTSNKGQLTKLAQRDQNVTRLIKNSTSSETINDKSNEHSRKLVQANNSLLVHHNHYHGQKLPARKVSFKVRNSAFTKSRSVTTVSASRVAQLASKFNQIQELSESNSESGKNKRKQSFRKDIVAKKNGSLHKNSTPLTLRDNNTNPSTPIKLNNKLIEKIQSSSDNKENCHIKRIASFKKLNSTNTVKATIQIFEQKKPAIPSKANVLIKKAYLESQALKLNQNPVPKVKNLFATTNTNKKDYHELRRKEQQPPRINTSKTVTTDIPIEDTNAILETKTHPEKSFENLQNAKLNTENNCLKTETIAHNENDLKLDKNKVKILPNNSFLWRTKSKECMKLIIESSEKPDINNEEEDFGCKLEYESIIAKADNLLEKYKQMDFHLTQNSQTNTKTNEINENIPKSAAENKSFLYNNLDTNEKDILEMSVNYEDLEEENNYEDCETLINSNKENDYDGEEIYEQLREPTLPSRQISLPALPSLPERKSIDSLGRKSDGDIHLHLSDLRKSDVLCNDKSDSSSYESISLPKSAALSKENVEAMLEKDFRLNYKNKLNSASCNSLNSNNGYEPINNGETYRESLSIISQDQKSNSLYGRWDGETNSGLYGVVGSELSSSDRSDEWVDVSEQDDSDNTYDVPSVLIIRERMKVKKADSNWSHKVRNQWKKGSMRKKSKDSENDHHYESLHLNDSSTDDYDSFESDSEFENISYTQNDDIGNHRLPDPPTDSNPYTFTRLATSAGKHMQRLRKNWFLTKNDLTKSLSRIAKKKSTSSMPEVQKQAPPIIEINIDDVNYQSSPTVTSLSPVNKDLPKPFSNDNEQNQASKSQSKFALYTPNPQRPSNSRFDKSEKSVKKKYSSLTSKLIRSFSMSGDMIAHQVQENGDDNLEKPKSTFYLSEEKHNLHENLSDRQCLSESQLIVDGKLNNNQNSQSTPKLSPGKNSKSQRTTWYTENQFQNEDKNSSGACWYTKIDLYKNNLSKDVASSEKSENSGDSFMSCSTLSSTDNVNPMSTIKQLIPTNMFTIIPENENNLINEMKSADLEINFNEKHGEDMQKRLLEEPLYQFYNAAVVESGMRMLCSSSSWNEIDGYEQIGEVKAPTPPRPTAMELIKPSQHGHVRTLWCEIPEVIDSDLLSVLNNHQKKLQEAKFELITSEASYLNSLNVLWNHFIMNLDKDHLLSKEDRSVLIKNIGPVKEAAEQLLIDLEACWQNSILLHGVCDIIRKYAEEKFKAYVSYCENQVYIDKLLKKIKEIKGPLPDLLNELESSPVCQSLPFNSFVMLPMQRVTRYPLLIDAILKRLKPEDDEFDSCQLTLATLNKLVSDCNDGARRVAQQEEFLKTWSKLDFSSVGGEPSPPPADGARLLIRSGEIIQLIARNDDIKHTFGKKFTKLQLHLFLFSDLLAITKTKNDNSYTVLQLCPRGFTEVNCGEYCKQFPVKDGAGKHLLFLTLLENHEGKTIEMLLSCGSESDKQRWYEAFSPPLSQDPDEILYESWDCPQVAALHAYTPTQPDEIALEIGDIVNVNKKMADGWYHGTRIRDGESGWFPGNHVMEVASAHIRARNLKQRYRLLALSGNYLESQKNARS